MVSFGSLYYLIPRVFGRTLYSLALVELHFWVATIGVVLYISAMWVSGIMQGLMWRAVNSDGTLTYSFVESVQAMHPFYAVRTIGGIFFLTGAIIMMYNVVKTVTGAEPAKVNDIIPEPALAH
jgi:cytochrome c oxidase cbb3-type subunit 1